MLSFQFGLWKWIFPGKTGIWYCDLSSKFGAYQRLKIWKESRKSFFWGIRKYICKNVTRISWNSMKNSPILLLNCIPTYLFGQWQTSQFHLPDLSLGWSIWFLNWLSSNLRSKWGDLPVLSPFPLSDFCLFRESLFLVFLHQYLLFQGDHSRRHYCLWHSFVFPRIFCTSTSLAVAWSGCKKRNSEVNIVLPDSWHILCVSGRQTGTVLGR